MKPKKNQPNAADAAGPGRRRFLVNSGVMLLKSAPGLSIAAQAPGTAAAGPAAGLTSVTLDKGWTVRGWTVREAASSMAVPAAVPGFVQTDLVAAGKLPALYLGMNMKLAEPVAEKEWLYETRFPCDAATAAAARQELVFQGLDCYAEVFLNGRSILKADNAFLTHRVAVDGVLRAGENRLEVRFASPLKTLRARAAAYPYYNEKHRKRDLNDLRKFARKAQYQFGWDLARKLTTVGIWRPVVLEAWGALRASDLQIAQEELSTDKARLRFDCSFDAAVAMTGVTVEVTVVETGQLVRAVFDLGQGRNLVPLRVEIERPRLWWCTGLGAQDLYHFEMRALRDGKVIASAKKRSGLRTTELVQQRDATGQSFYIKLNGVPVFQKGANYVPVDMPLTQVTERRYRKMIDDALATNMNTLRIWGGGIYEEDVFYDLCDEKGIMVFHDFMFASAMPPADDAYLASVRLEIAQQILRLRNHPSLILWAGNNENESAWFQELKKTYPIQVYMDQSRIFNRIIPGLVKEHFPEIPYTRSSPSTNIDGMEPKAGWGDTHAWAVWFGKIDIEKAMGTRTIRCASEYGFVGYGPMRSLKKFLKPGERGRDHPAFRYHDAYDGIEGVIDEFLGRYYTVPADLEAYVYLSGLMQGEVTRALNELYRRCKPVCMGAMLWQLNDVWPVASWSLIDYYGEWKAANYFTRDAFAPVLVSPVLEKDKVLIHLVSDRREAVAGTLEVAVHDFTGGRTPLLTRAVGVGYDAAVVAAELSREAALAGHDPAACVLVARLTVGAAQVSRNLLYFKRPKDLALPPAEPDVTLSDVRGGILARLRCPVIAKNVFLDSGAVEGHWEDNYFDLLPGETKEVLFRPATPVKAKALEAGLTITTLNAVMGKAAAPCGGQG
ncbi:beta-mannosidase [Massilia glaciei]|uniref:Beta-mannosidase n=1 Tax=Massilia glaciei TaxID=1524097 RepID=A0A2U2HLZ4_9BURK|nr:glycoside hydrolase family 2 protein [Massilia glaciei]PWF48456.1 glycoside hydrolase family 2 protein [Massilia glaciei]